MKKTIVSLVISALVLAGLVLWALEGEVSGNIQEALMVAGVVLMVGFGLFIGIGRARSLRRKEPPEDELSKNVLNRAASLSYYISIYMWLLVLLLSDRISMSVNSLIGAGILGMAVIFLFCWIGVRAFAMKHD
ncbi:MAG TPA: hypothetical protein ENN40_09140 [Candidatus Aminicenantes bacterium]|nr:hypothetical protein [Candidatus Aminicenantes bacterium]